MITDRIPPQDINAERTVLASMLVDSAACDVGLELLTEGSFYALANQIVFKAISGVLAGNQPVDIITVSAYLFGTQELETIGGEIYLSYLIEGIASVANIEAHCKILLDKAALRGLIGAAQNILDSAFDSDAVGSEMVDRAGGKIFALADTRYTWQLESVGQLLPAAMDNIERYQTGNVHGLIKTGFDRLDQSTGGFNPGELIIVAARPSMGKSALMSQIAVNLAKRGTPSAIFSLEMTKDSLVQRMICAEAEIESQRIRAGRMARSEYAKIGVAAQAIHAMPIYIDDTPGINIMEIRAKCRRAKNKFGIALVMVDYLQQMRSNERGENRQQEISGISLNLKALAKELHVPVVALCQLSRAPEQRSEHRPLLSDLRESGAIEQDADTVLFLYRDWVYTQDDKTKNLCEIIIGKQRNGPICTVKVSFVPEFAKFGNLTTKEKEIPHDGDF